MDGQCDILSNFQTMCQKSHLSTLKSGKTMANFGTKIQNSPFFRTGLKPVGLTLKNKNTKSENSETAEARVSKNK